MGGVDFALAGEEGAEGSGGSVLDHSKDLLVAYGCCGGTGCQGDEDEGDGVAELHFDLIWRENIGIFGRVRFGKWRRWEF